MADIEAGITKAIETTNSFGHTHFVELTAEDFAALKLGQPVTKKSCDGGDHEYVIGCGQTSEPELPTCNNEVRRRKRRHLRLTHPAGVIAQPLGLRCRHQSPRDS